MTLAGAELAGPQAIEEIRQGIDATDLAHLRARVASQVDFLKKLSDELLRQAESQPPSERISGGEAEAIWQEMRLTALRVRISV